MIEFLWIFSQCEDFNEEVDLGGHSMVLKGLVVPALLGMAQYFTIKTIFYNYLRDFFPNL